MPLFMSLATAELIYIGSEHQKIYGSIIEQVANGCYAPLGQSIQTAATPTDTTDHPVYGMHMKVSAEL